MKQRILIGFFVASLLVTILFISSPAQEKTLSIEGSYMLVQRELADGNKQGPPDIMGMMTFTKKYRNFNIMMKDKEGKFFSLSTVVEYTLTSDMYTEKTLFSITNDEINGKDVNYDLAGNSVSVPVTSDGNSLKFQIPNSPMLTVTGDKVIAKGENFIDTWKKVE
jgi:hypothetical protein